jgi:hypothetical protein
VFSIFCTFRENKEVAMPTVLHHRNVPDVIRSLSPEHDYVDVFTLTTGAARDRSVEQWARAGIEDAAGLAGQFVWRVVLGLRLETRPDRVGGWKIADRGDDWLRVEASSWFLTAHMLVHVHDAQVTVATFIRYDTPLARLVWPRLAVGHRRAMPGLLRRAAHSLTEAS